MLTPHHLTLLRQDLRTLAHIEYQEVENELLDHYAMLTEQKMETGQVFEYASANAWKELGEGIGLQQIQEEFIKNIRKQISSRHLEILKSYFRWPTVIGTLFICGLVYQLSTVLGPKTIYIVTQFLFLSPGLILIYALVRKEHRHTDTRKLAWQYMNSRANIPTAFLQFNNMLPFFLNNEDKPTPFLLMHPSISTGLACVLLIYTLTFMELYRENFSYKTAH
ncbi:hypothetical protein [Larkinella punicea]|uniref:Uncharacterized protein n=1 Tax=Larkinella punicea TaxID=2315727 RepID=A0A368JU80_9BACT|nr:hypothetical protein [Larkinella punicea]RCR70234.1 hypothetical protein DUE52_07675 [Larkinella punicea]